MYGHFFLQSVETSPFDVLSHAALAWLRQNLAQCDVLHVHEWGGVFVDVITAAAYRQLRPGGFRDVLALAFQRSAAS